MSAWFFMSTILYFCFLIVFYDKVFFAISLLYITPFQKAPHGIYVWSQDFFIKLFSVSLFSALFHHVCHINVELEEPNIQKAK